MPPAAPVTYPRHYTAHLDGCHVELVGTIQGLKGEARHVDAAWQRFGGAPDKVAIGVGAEDLGNLERMGREGEEGVAAFLSQELDTGSYEEAILPQLARFGDIIMPPDDLLRADELARGAGAEVVALDLDDEDYADLYVAHISGWQMIRGQMKQKKLVARGGESATSAEELMLLWDQEFGALKGYRSVEEERENVMAGRVRDAARGCSRMLVVLPYARLQGVAGRIGAKPRA